MLDRNVQLELLKPLHYARTKLTPSALAGPQPKIRQNLAMTENVYWVFELAINPGRFDDLKTLMAAMVEATQKNEAGALNYEWAISDDRQVCHIYERCQDSAAVMTHVGSFANFTARFMELVKPTRLVVYGTPSAQVKDALAGLSPVYMAPFGGFRR
jgi:quinol monooxygenase YgiN